MKWFPKRTEGTGHKRIERSQDKSMLITTGDWHARNWDEVGWE
jgi:hypothetical protein